MAGLKVLVVGGGRAGREILDLLQDLEGWSVVGVVDPNLQAPGMVRAREHGVAALTDMDEAILRRGAELIVDLTGGFHLQAQLTGLARPGQTVVSGAAAQLLYALLITTQERRSRAAAHKVAGELHGFVGALQGATGSIQDSLQKIGDVMRRMQVVSLNAGIEAAKAGVHGKGFGVVAEEMARMTAQASLAVEGVRDASRQTERALAAIEGTEARIQGLMA